MRSLVLATFAALAVFAVPSSATRQVEAATNLSRAEIRAMPIEKRPSRPGHFYGNAVRRRTGR